MTVEQGGSLFCWYDESPAINLISSRLPLFINLESHCSPSQNVVVAKLFKDVFQGELIKCIVKLMFVSCARWTTTNCISKRILILLHYREHWGCKHLFKTGHCKMVQPDMYLRSENMYTLNRGLQSSTLFLNWSVNIHLIKPTL